MVRRPTQRTVRAGAMTRGEWPLVAGVAAAALALRLLYLSEVGDHPLFAALTADPAVYHAQARGILNGVLAPDHAYFHSSPLYPFFLAAVMRLAGPGLQTVRLVQACVGCVSVVLIYVLSRLTVGRRPAIVAAAFAAVYVPFIFFEAEFLEITLVIAFLTGSLIALQRAADAADADAPAAERASGRGHSRTGLWLALAAGTLLGLASLGKPNLLLFAPAGAVWLVARSRGGTLQREGRRRETGRRAGARTSVRAQGAAAALFAVACGLTILPATIHNYRTDGDLIPVSSNGGINLYIGNHPGAPGTFTVPRDMRFDLRTASKEAAERATGRTLSAGEVSSYWTRQALAFIRERPWMWLDQTARKFALFWNHYEIPNHYDLAFVAQAAPVLRIPLGTFAVVAPLGLAGLALATARRKNVGVLVVFILTFMCSVVPFFVTARYRLAVVPALLPGAGYALHELATALRAARWRSAAAVAVPAAALALLVNVDILEFSTAQMHNTMGAILAQRGDIESAVPEFTAALDENPADASARRNLGLAYLALGRYDDAARELERAVRVHPRYFEAWLELGQARACQDSMRAARAAWSAVLAMDPPPQVASEARRLLSTHAEEEQR